MKPPQAFKRKSTRQYSFSYCTAHRAWVRFTNVFQHEGKLWHLCENDYEDYWFNTDVLASDYKGYS